MLDGMSLVVKSRTALLTHPLPDQSPGWLHYRTKALPNDFKLAIELSRTVKCDGRVR